MGVAKNNGGAVVGYLRLAASIAVLVLVGSSPSFAAAAGDPISVRIVPTSSRDGRRAIELIDAGDHFHVLVTNNTKQPIRLWREWCSWGYFNLSFEARTAGGKATQVSKRLRGWDKNFPDWTSIPAGESLVLDVTLDPSIWESSPLADPSGKALVRLRATYQVREDKYATTEGVWTGKVSSPEEEYLIYWMSEEAKQTARRLQDLEKRRIAQPGVAAEGAARRR